jgi:RHS repeat-associated protein
VRFDFADSIPGRPFFRWAPFSLVPHWNLRGEADNGSFADGALTKCMSDGVGQRCVQVRWPFGWTATAQQAYVRDLWHGSLVESKRDGSGLLFRRSRYVDPASGRFTQEDPIGLAGGMNLYGFAGGDPVNFTDPFGLYVDPVTGTAVVIASGQALATAGVATGQALAAAAVTTGAALVATGEVVGAALALSGQAVKATAIGTLRSLGLKDAHHIIQDAAVRDLPGYSTSAAPGVQLAGPANASGTSHNAATRVQRQAGGGTYAAERRIAYKALRAAGFSPAGARSLVEQADMYFQGIGVTGTTSTRMPGNRP